MMFLIMKGTQVVVGSPTLFEAMLVMNGLEAHGIHAEIVPTRI